MAIIQTIQLEGMSEGLSFANNTILIEIPQFSTDSIINIEIIDPPLGQFKTLKIHYINISKIDNKSYKGVYTIKNVVASSGDIQGSWPVGKAMTLLEGELQFYVEVTYENNDKITSYTSPFAINYQNGKSFIQIIKNKPTFTPAPGISGGGKGDGSGYDMIRVKTLPTENIKTDVIYELEDSKGDAELWMLANDSVNIPVVEYIKNNIDINVNIKTAGVVDTFPSITDPSLKTTSVFLNSPDGEIWIYYLKESGLPCNYWHHDDGTIVQYIVNGPVPPSDISTYSDNFVWNYILLDEPLILPNDNLLLSSQTDTSLVANIYVIKSTGLSYCYYQDAYGNIQEYDLSYNNNGDPWMNKENYEQISSKDAFLYTEWKSGYSYWRYDKQWQRVQLKENAVYKVKITVPGIYDAAIIETSNINDTLTWERQLIGDQLTLALSGNDWGSNDWADNYLYTVKIEEVDSINGLQDSAIKKHIIEPYSKNHRLSTIYLYYSPTEGKIKSYDIEDMSTIVVEDVPKELCVTREEFWNLTPTEISSGMYVVQIAPKQITYQYFICKNQKLISNDLILPVNELPIDNIDPNIIYKLATNYYYLEIPNNTLALAGIWWAMATYLLITLLSAGTFPIPATTELPSISHGIAMLIDNKIKFSNSSTINLYIDRLGTEIAFVEQANNEIVPVLYQILWNGVKQSEYFENNNINDGFGAYALPIHCYYKYKNNQWIEYQDREKLDNALMIVEGTKPGSWAIKAKTYGGLEELEKLLNGIDSYEELTWITKVESLHQILQELCNIENNNLGVITIPTNFLGKNITEVAQEAFAGHSAISITVPDGITRIGSQAFTMRTLGSLIFSDSITSIGSYIFCYDGSLFSAPPSMILWRLSGGIQDYDLVTFGSFTTQILEVPTGVKKINIYNPNNAYAVDVATITTNIGTIIINDPETTLWLGYEDFSNTEVSHWEPYIYTETHFNQQTNKFYSGATVYYKATNNNIAPTNWSANDSQTIEEAIQGKTFYYLWMCPLISINDGTKDWGKVEYLGDQDMHITECLHYFKASSSDDYIGAVPSTYYSSNNIPASAGWVLNTSAWSYTSSTPILWMITLYKINEVWHSTWARVAYYLISNENVTYSFYTIDSTYDQVTSIDKCIAPWQKIKCKGQILKEGSYGYDYTPTLSAPPEPAIVDLTPENCPQLRDLNINFICTG